jgi:hypothetical protein
MEDLTKGEIYLITNIANGKCYVGQAKKYVSRNKDRWGTEGRWKSHIREAMSMAGHCVYLDNAIRAYGPDSFDVKVICDCNIEEMNEIETRYIHKYNTLAPNGYNIKPGGQSSAYRSDVPRKLEDRCMASDYQKLGIKEDTLEYIQPILTRGLLAGYRVLGLKDANSKDIPTRNFIEKTNKWNWSNAIRFIEIVQEMTRSGLTCDNWASLDIKPRPSLDEEILPPFLLPTMFNGVKTGYRIHRYPLIQDDGSVKKIDKIFENMNMTMEQKKKLAFEYLQELEASNAAIRSRNMSSQPPTPSAEMTYIYLIRNKLNGKCFIGRAKEYLYAGKKLFGVEGCWKMHVRESQKGFNGSNPKLHEAMLQDGLDNFEMSTLEKVEDTKSVEIVRKYVQDYQALAPEGYNMTEGGKGGKKCSESCDKIKLQKANMDKEAFIEKMREANLGKIGAKNKRKYEEDNDLPKYVISLRRAGVLIGYKIDKFPTGGGGDKLAKIFKSKDDPSKALERAKKHLEELYVQYPHVREVIKSDEDEVQEPKQPEQPANLPDNVYAIFTADGIIKGYKVEGDNIPLREFVESYNNHVNLDKAVKYIQQTTTGVVTDEIKRRKKTSILPKYVRHVYYGGELKGYAIEIAYTDENSNKVTYAKNFSNQDRSLDENLELAKEHLTEFLKKTKISS